MIPQAMMVIGYLRVQARSLPRESVTTLINQHYIF